MERYEIAEPYEADRCHGKPQLDPGCEEQQQDHQPYDAQNDLAHAPSRPIFIMSQMKTTHSIKHETPTPYVTQ